MRRVRVRIRGRVQGVFFRAETRSRADSLGVGGWIRNAEDGSVEAAFEGPDEAVERLVAWSRRGPRGADVDSVEVTEEAPRGETRFVVR